MPCRRLSGLLRAKYEDGLSPKPQEQRRMPAGVCGKYGNARLDSAGCARFTPAAPRPGLPTNWFESARPVKGPLGPHGVWPTTPRIHSRGPEFCESMTRDAAELADLTAVNAVKVLEGVGDTATERRAQAELARCVLGVVCIADPAFDRCWLVANGGAVARLAEVIYADHAFDRMPILADALEDAGCANQDILAHCRDGGEHVRGCWVLDALLNKE